MYHIFIASCIEAIHIQIPRLINNITLVNIPPEYVHIIVGGCDNNTVEYINGIEIVKVNYRCFEFTPHIFISNNPDKYHFDYAFFTHDTVKFGTHFYETICNDISELKRTTFDTKKIENCQLSMNIGIYSKNIILKNKNTLDSICCYTNDSIELMNLKNKLVHYEDFIFRENNMPSEDSSRNIDNTFYGVFNNTSANGYIRYFDRIDFIKYQSNANYIQSIDICKIE